MAHRVKQLEKVLFELNHNHFSEKEDPPFLLNEQSFCVFIRLIAILMLFKSDLVGGRRGRGNLNLVADGEGDSLDLGIFYSRLPRFRYHITSV